ncbi:hypothetical protein IV203_026697 [Nitzschia inconspicua]|uniref:Uncharacterized protein n=1 Tax=Nitzschia inconspicua TaxID=303405 RepID=A0A9K3LJS6_9STRA|nr:hypothetical protein IV203_026697 [Nitzschia inconspicua]
MSSSRLLASPKRPPSADRRKKVDEDVLALEAELEKVNLELSIVRNERNKQRQQLASLSEENKQLTHQKEQRLKRNQLSSQLQDLNKVVKRKTSKKQRALEDLEQAKSRHRQLKRTVDLLQGGVQAVLSKSYYYDQKESKTTEGKVRSQRRQELLKSLVSEDLKTKLLTSSLSNMTFDVHSVRQNGRLDDEDDEITEDTPKISLFSDKNKRLDSANSEVSTNDYMKHANTTYKVPSIAAIATNDNNNHSSRSHSRKSRSKNRSKNGRRSPSNGSSSGRNRSNSRDRSTRSSNSQGKSQSRRGRRPNTSRQPNEGGIVEESEDGHDVIIDSASTSTKSGLASMLESSRSGHDSDDHSDDTPKTANTNG